MNDFILVNKDGRYYDGKDWIPSWRDALFMTEEQMELEIMKFETLTCAGMSVHFQLQNMCKDVLAGTA